MKGYHNVFESGQGLKNPLFSVLSVVVLRNLHKTLRFHPTLLEIYSPYISLWKLELKGYNLFHYSNFTRKMRHQGGQAIVGGGGVEDRGDKW